jgi:hypothetical protein
MHPEPTSDTPITIRPRWMHQLAFAFAGVGVLWLAGSGRLFANFRAFRSGDPATSPAEPFVTGVLWLVAIGPILLLAYDLGSQHTEARRFRVPIWRGLRESWRVAWRGVRAVDLAEDFGEAPDDDVTGAVTLGAIVALILPTFFLSFAAPLRTVGGVVWVSIAGLIAGTIAYCYRRAAAYMIDEPGRWSMMRQWSLMNPDRYAPADQPFVKAQIALTVLLWLWWLGMGPVFLFK